MTPNARIRTPTSTRRTELRYRKETSACIIPLTVNNSVSCLDRGMKQWFRYWSQGIYRHLFSLQITPLDFCPVGILLRSSMSANFRLLFVLWIAESTPALWNAASSPYSFRLTVWCNDKIMEIDRVKNMSLNRFLGHTSSYCDFQSMLLQKTNCLLPFGCDLRQHNAKPLMQHSGWFVLMIWAGKSRSIAIFRCFAFCNILEFCKKVILL